MLAFFAAASNLSPLGLEKDRDGSGRRNKQEHCLGQGGDKKEHDERSPSVDLPVGRQKIGHQTVTNEYITDVLLVGAPAVSKEPP